MTTGRRMAGAVLAAALAAACGDGSPARPTSGALVTFDVSGETFRVWLSTPDRIAAARAARDGAAARIPNGRVVSGTQYNTGWSWHLEDVEFAEATIEVCDGRPSDVERAGVGYGGGRYCPWGASILRIEEF